MLVRFTVENYRSVKDSATLDFRAAKKFSAENLEENLFVLPDQEGTLLNVLLVYGANASGKSNILKAVGALERFVSSSSNYKVDAPIPVYDPFKLNAITKKQPTSFEIEFYAKDQKRYVYKVVFNQKYIELEELSCFGGEDRSRKNLLFSRRTIGDTLKIKFGSIYRGIRKFNLYPNQLVLSQVGSTPNEILLPAYQFFRKYIYCSTIHDTRYDDALIESFKNLLEEEDSIFRQNINRLIRAADTAIQEIVTKQHDVSEFTFPEDIPNDVKEKVLQKLKRRVKAIHNVYKDGEVVNTEEFELEEESTGTIKLLVVGGVIIDALNDGSTLLIDELDKSLHPLLTKMLLSLFSNPQTNPNQAQLVLATHDVTLLDKELFRLDQVLFADKKLNGASDYTRLSEYTGLSKLAQLANWYLLGRFGGTPMIDEYELDLEIPKA